MTELSSKPIIHNTAVISMCFLLTSTGYLAWVYHLMEQVSPQVSDAMSMVAGYALQAVGIALFSVCLRYWRAHIERSLCAALLLHLLCLVPAVLSPSLSGTLAAGSCMNLLCGWIAGYYLYRLSCGTEAGHRAVTLGVGYGISILASWLLSIVGNGALYYSERILPVCAALTAAAFAVIRMQSAAPAEKHGGAVISSLKSTGVSADTSPKNSGVSVGSSLNSTGVSANLSLNNADVSVDTSLKKHLFSAILLILLFSIVNSCGFAFPAADLENGINLEFSRLFYAVGLLIAGFVNDRNRKQGAVCALAALVIPFIMLALRGEPVPMMIFWALSYFTFGFYSVYRMVLFSDFARDTGILYLSGFGLMAGRAGDAVGEALCLALENRLLLLLCVSALFFMAATFLFFRIYPTLYLTAPVPADTPGSSSAPGVKDVPSSVPADVCAPVPASSPLPAPAPSPVPAPAPIPVPAQPQVQSRNEQEFFQRFCAQYNLSLREREVLRYLLAEKTNAEIADVLSISEGTVKYHIHNLLQKTGCRNRIALLAAYFVGKDET